MELRIEVDAALADALQECAARAGMTAEAAHRKILEQALGPPPRRNFADALAAIPAVGRAKDFRRAGRRVAQ